MADTYEMLEARQLLEAGQYSEALSMLEKTPAEERSADWYFLRSQISSLRACAVSTLRGFPSSISARMVISKDKISVSRR